MIVTVTPNPSLDRTFVIESLARGTVNRALDSRVDPGGKGVNVSVALAVNGYRTTAVVPRGGVDGIYLAELLERAGVNLHLVPISSDTRTNFTLVEHGGIITKVNAPGPLLSAEEQTALRGATVRLSAGSDWVVACGSLPPSVDPTFYADLVREVESPIAVDTTGEALMEAVRAGADLIKPNLQELADATGRQPRTLGDVVEIADDLRREGAKAVLVSLGRHGAVLVGDEVIHGAAGVANVVSSVGAGDALLAGFLCEPAPSRERLARALAWASASCETANTEMPTPERIAKQSVTVYDVADVGRVLT